MKRQGDKRKARKRKTETLKRFLILARFSGTGHAHVMARDRAHALELIAQRKFHGSDYRLITVEQIDVVKVKHNDTPRR